MTSSGTRLATRPVRIAAWLSLLLTALLVVGAGYADRRLKTASHPGYLPENMPLYLYSADLPLSWLRFSKTPLAYGLTDEAAPVLQDITLQLRQLTGIRPTPARWRTWLGASIVAATEGPDWILCVRPGLAVRAASLLFGGRPFPGPSIHQAWRDGFLLLSSNATLLEKALAARPLTLDIPEGTTAGTLVLQTQKPLQMVLSLTLTADLPIVARIIPAAPVPPSQPRTWTAPVLPDNPAALLLISGTQSAAHLAAIIGEVDLPDVSGGLFATLFSRWNLNRVPAAALLSGSLDAPISCGLYSLSNDSGVPLPQIALASFSQRPLVEMLPREPSANNTLPYVWNGCPGWMFPLFGDHFSLYGFERDGANYLATQEPLAAMLAAAPYRRGPAIEDDVFLDLNWKATAKAVIETAAWAAERELLAETGPKDLEAAFVPVMRALAKCGSLHIAGRWTPDGFECKGALTKLRHSAARQ